MTEAAVTSENRAARGELPLAASIVLAALPLLLFVLAPGLGVVGIAIVAAAVVGLVVLNVEILRTARLTRGWKIFLPILATAVGGALELGAVVLIALATWE